MENAKEDSPTKNQQFAIQTVQSTSSSVLNFQTNNLPSSSTIFFSYQSVYPSLLPSKLSSRHGLLASGLPFFASFQARS
jgi:hypothetical protein